ncbi:TetR/AcrR family transcriptional regulator [Desulfobacter curvatus]|uniref:TetR/AcrR family transcriptional regulator n=1 Tax=Desulfobacter curvatus TaxID=2290 RepID=UPI0003690ECF|nr:TetR/AcrR family transcriptional regulator [Desulfobacter curvatus]
MNRKQASKEETRRLILQAARKLFFEENFSRCTMRRVAAEAGVSAASVVVHFKNKTALMEAALSEDIGRTWEGALNTMPAKGTIATRIKHIWLTMFIFYDGNRNLYRELLSSTVLKVEADTPALRKDIDSFLNRLVTIIEDEKTADRMAGDVDSMILSMSLFSQYFGVEIMFFRDPAITPKMAAEMAEKMNRQTLTGLENPSKMQ